MRKYISTKISSLTENEITELRKNVSGYYTNEKLIGVGSWDVIIDFKDGTSVAGRLIRDGEEGILGFNYNESIYNPNL